MLQNKTEDLKIAIEKFKLYINLILMKLNEIQMKNLTNETLDSIADKIHNEFIKELKQSKSFLLQ